MQALSQAGLLKEMRDRGIEYLYYHQVDNLLAIVCDPVFLGFHALRAADISTRRSSPRRVPRREWGVVVEIDGQTQIIEYSDLPLDAARRLTAEGELELWAGNTAMHVFSRAFSGTDCGRSAGVALSTWPTNVSVSEQESQVLVEPEVPNAFKFERFIFDVLPHARTSLVFEADRSREFNPVKNSTGANSPKDVQASLTKLYAGWLKQAGVEVPEGTPVEISPLFALEFAELSERIPSDFRCQGPVYLEPRAA